VGLLAARRVEPSAALRIAVVRSVVVDGFGSDWRERRSWAGDSIRSNTTRPGAVGVCAQIVSESKLRSLEDVMRNGELPLSPDLVESPAAIAPVRREGRKDDGGGRIRTCEGIGHGVYSATRLSASVLPRTGL
jgi:hypothetical protein